MIDRDQLIVDANTLLFSADDLYLKLCEANFTNTDESNKIVAHFECIRAFMNQYTDRITSFVNELEDSE